ncbi:uncharacterized protein LOC117956122 isoform X2 [Xyrichtys novacula]|uniref:Uncharacterized protein LOC117956122 isoform X2 n=1 Tax=Xyrichtys novacula TaxID=13765 RepID=A0AAV1FR12_XYRNO|nr:uncharacterized protein LOC117956122 isoform X2 [Xyrichtys novacula]
MPRQRRRGGTAAPTDKYVLCKIPEEWARLPLVRSRKFPLPCNSVAVYWPITSSREVVYAGHICPKSSQEMPESALKPPLKNAPLREKLLKLKEKNKADEALTEAISKLHRDLNFSTSINPEPKAIKEKESSNEDPPDEPEMETHAEPEAPSGRENTPQLVTNYPLPYDILDQRERLLPPPWSEGSHFEAIVDLDSLYMELGFSPPH